MEPIKLIERLCEIGSTEQCGIYVHEPANLRATFGEYTAIQTAKNSKLVICQAYVYDYKCEISDTPDAMIFTKDAPDSPIGLYKIDGYGASHKAKRLKNLNTVILIKENL